jgi:hypothetical protein
MHLKRVVSPRLRRLNELRALSEYAAKSSGREQDRLLLCVAIELANLWAEFCKVYILKSAVGVTTLSGSRWRATVGPTSNSEKVRIFLMTAVNGVKKPNPLNPMHEPDWKDLSVLVQCCVALGLPNINSVRAAAGLGLSFLSELAPTRNYAAHKSKLARTKLDQIATARGIAVRSDLPGIMLAPGSSGRGTIALEWLTEVENSIVVMCH